MRGTNDTRSMLKNDISRGQIYIADLNPVVGSVQGGCRPVLIVQNDMGNKHSPTTIVVPLTKQLEKPKLPTHVEIAGLSKKSIALCEQIKTLDKGKLGKLICNVNSEQMTKVNNAMAISIGLKF